MPTWLANSSGAAPVPPSLPSTTMKSGTIPVSSIALTMHMNSRRWPMHSLKPTGLPSDSSRSLPMNCIISIGVVKTLCEAGDTQSMPHRHAARLCDLGRDLGGGQHAAMPRLGALAQLDLDQLDLFVLGLLGEAFGVERAVVVAAAEIAGPDLVDQIAAALAVIAADPALAGVMGKAAHLGTLVQRQNRIGRQGAETHRGNVVERGLVGLLAVRSADGDAEIGIGAGAPG